LRGGGHAFLQGFRAAGVCGSDESNCLVGDFVLPSFEVLECVGAG